MAWEQREGQGSLFRNEQRSKDTHPNARGTALIGGVLYEVSAWTKEGKSGKFQSLAFKPKEDAKPASKGNPAFDGMVDGDEDGKLPF